VSDTRVPLNPAIEAFGLPATVTPPGVGQTPITTSGFWVSALAEEAPAGTELRRRDPRRVFVLPLSTAVPEQDRGALLAAAEYDGGVTKNWKVTGLGQVVEPDCQRLIVIPA